MEGPGGTGDWGPAPAQGVAGDEGYAYLPDLNAVKAFLSWLIQHRENFLEIILDAFPYRNVLSKPWHEPQPPPIRSTLWPSRAAGRF
jgi:hypothetical protein